MSGALGEYVLEFPVRASTLTLIGEARMEREFVRDGLLRVRAARLELAEAQTWVEWFGPADPERPKGWPAPYADDVSVLVVHYPVTEFGVHGPARSLADEGELMATRLGDWTAAVRLRPSREKLVARLLRRLGRRT